MTIRQPVKGAAAFSKTIAVLQLIADSERPPTSVELVKKAQMPRPTMRRILKALIAEDMIELRQDKTYTLGARNIEFARKALDQNGLLQTVNTDLKWLAEKSKSTAYLGIPVGNEFIFITGKDDGAPVGSYGPYHACSIAKSYLANVTQDRQRQIVGSIDMPAITQYSTINAEDLYSELNQVKQDGYSLGNQQMKLGEKCFGTCIFDANEMPCAGIGFTKALPKLDSERESNYIAILLQCRDRINQNLKQASYNRPQRSI